MTEDQKTFQQQIMARAMKDEEFRQELLSNPKAVLESELGITLPQDLTIHVHEDTPITTHLVLPMNPLPGEPELSDTELDAVAFSHVICSKTPKITSCRCQDVAS